MPLATSERSNPGAWRMNSMYSRGVQKPITRSTPARLYQERSNITISPAVGRWATYRWKYHCPSSVSFGLVSATTRPPRGLRFSVKRLIEPPLPAASRPSNRTTTRRPSSRMARCSLSSSICRRRSSALYALDFSASAWGGSSSISFMVSGGRAMGAPGVPLAGVGTYGTDRGRVGCTRRLPSGRACP